MKLDKFLQSLLLTSAIAVLIGTPAKGEDVGEDIREANKNIPQLDEIELPATSAQMVVRTFRIELPRWETPYSSVEHS